MLAMSSLMMPVPMLGASQLVHKPPEAKLLAIHSAAAAAHNQPQATPQHHMQQANHMQQQQMQQQQSKPGTKLIRMNVTHTTVSRSFFIRELWIIVIAHWPSVWIIFIRHLFVSCAMSLYPVLAVNYSII